MYIYQNSSLFRNYLSYNVIAVHVHIKICHCLSYNIEDVHVHISKYVLNQELFIIQYNSCTCTYQNMSKIRNYLSYNIVDVHVLIKICLKSGINYHTI